MITNDIKKILNDFDFTDSIVSKIQWSDNLLDLELSLSYYWDLQEGKEECRDLKFTFKRCSNVSFNIDKELLNNAEHQENYYSWFTIIHFEEPKEKCINIYTTDYSLPWLSLQYNEVILEEI